MFGGNQAADNVLLKTVNQRLQRGGGGSQGRISATVSQGSVTLTGNLQYDAQRSPLLKSVARIAGVRRVIDQLKVKPKAAYPEYVPAPKDPVEATVEPTAAGPEETPLAE
jgi:hypothetical protein